MAKPPKGDWDKLIRLGRYLKGAPRCVQVYEWQEEGAALVGYSDSDWAGCRTTAKSTSGGLIQMGTRLLKTWSRTHDSVTLSSAETELVALSKLALEVLGVRSMALEWKVIKVGCPCPLYADASAALSIAKRQGAGKMGHINVRTLWLQEKVVQEVLESIRRYAVRTIQPMDPQSTCDRNLRNSTLAQRTRGLVLTEPAVV